MKKSVFLAVLASLSLVACTTPSDPTTAPTSNPTTSEPTTQTTTPSTTVPSVSEPTTSAPTASDPTTSIDDPTSDPTTKPDVPSIPELPSEPEAGKTRLYFLAESWWYDSGENGTAIFTDSISYPGEVMYLVEEIGSKAVFAYDVDLNLTTEIGFVAFELGEYLPTNTISILDVVMDSKPISVSDLGNDNLVALNEDEADTTRSLYVFSDVYVPGQGEYVRPDKPIEPDNPTPVEKTRIYFMDRDWWNYDDAKTSFYYWNSSTDSGEYPFPGVTARKLETIETDMDTVVNVYYADINLEAYDSILFNRVAGSNIEGALATNTLKAQTADYKIADMGENNMIVLTHDEFVFNSNVKCETKLAVYEPGKWDYGQFESGPVVIEPLDEVVTVYYSNSAWPSIYIYAWNDATGTSNASWPGELMTKDTETGLWSYQFNTEFDKLIFNNGEADGANQKTDDLFLLGYSNDKPYWNGSAWAPLPGSVPDDSEPITVYYKNNSWSQIYAYTWNDSGYKVAWPGELMTKDPETNIWSYNLTSNYTYIIFNNGSGSQTADISLNGHSEDTPFYDGSRWTAIPGNETPEPEQPEQPEIPVEPSGETFTVTFQNNWLWTDVKIYYWGSETVVDATWPGESMKQVDVGDDSYEYYSFELPTDVKGFIFNGIKNDGSNNRDQSPDITPENPNFFNENGYWCMFWNNKNEVQFNAF